MYSLLPPSSDGTPPDRRPGLMVLLAGWLCQVLRAHRDRDQPHLGRQDRREEDPDQVPRQGEGRSDTSLVCVAGMALSAFIPPAVRRGRAGAVLTVGSPHRRRLQRRTGCTSPDSQSPRQHNARVAVAPLLIFSRAAHHRDQDSPLAEARKHSPVPPVFRGYRLRLHSPRGLRLPGEHPAHRVRAFRFQTFEGGVVTVLLEILTIQDIAVLCALLTSALCPLRLNPD